MTVTRGRGKKNENFADVIYGRPLTQNRRQRIGVRNGLAEFPGFAGPSEGKKE